jgi:hypothetical protein
MKTQFRADKTPTDAVVGIKVGQEAGKLSAYLALVVPDMRVCSYSCVESTSG